MWVSLVTLLAACTTSTGTTTVQAPAITQPALATTSTTGTVDTAERLVQLGAQPCPDSDFTCVTIEVPLDHFRDGDETTEVVFAVLPATGERRGAFLTATGGPGTSGIASADSYTSLFDEAITESLDVVFFDQRGIGKSGHLSCPTAAASYYQADPLTGLGFDQVGLSAAAEQFATECRSEAGDSPLWPFLSTAQVVEDIETFRQSMGYQTLIVYGESYGTQVAQTYAATHGDHLERMIIDGVVDLTLEGHEFFVDQAEAFGDTLQASFDECLEDPYCEGDFTSVLPEAEYDRLVSLLIEAPLSADFPLADGTTTSKTLTLGDLEVIAAGQMYGEVDRMMFVRALAASARNELVPLLRLLYPNLGVDPVDESLVPDDTWSDAIYYGVECLEYHYPGDTPAEKAAGFFDNGEGFETKRLGSIVLGDLPCAFWPEAPAELARPEPLTAPGVPTMVLGATADPATPYHQGVDVLGHLEDGYLITQHGGPHVIFGRGNECPDNDVTAFIVNGVAKGGIECEGYVIDYYPPLFPEAISDFPDAETFLLAVEDEVTFLPEYWYWDGMTETAAGCAHGGIISMESTDEGESFVFEGCSLSPDAALSGEASYDYENDVFTMEGLVAGSDDCVFSYQRSGGDFEVDDQCPGLFD